MIAAFVATLLAVTTAAIALPQPLTDYGPPIASLTRAQARALRSRPWNGLGPKDAFVFANEHHPDRTVRTCRDLAAAVRDGYAPADNATNKMSERMVGTCGLLDAVILANGPAHEPPISLAAHLDRISMAALEPVPSEDAAPAPEVLAQRDHRSIAQYARDRHCTIPTATTVQLILHCEGWALALTTMLQADMDGSGRDGLVVQPYVASLEGSLSYAGPNLLLAWHGANRLYVPRAMPTLAP